MVLPCRICMHETSNHTHPTWSVSWSISLTVFLRTNSSRPCPIHGSLSRPAAYCMPAGDLAAIVVLARRSIRRSISLLPLWNSTMHCMLAFAIACVPCNARQHWHGFLPLNSPSSWTIYMSRGAYDLTEEMCHLSVICESGYMGMDDGWMLHLVTRKYNRKRYIIISLYKRLVVLYSGPVWSLKKWWE